MKLESFKKEGIDRVVAGVSGGADSMAMLRLYLDAGIKIHAVHCNFHLRGSESDRDQEFVMEECKRLNVPLTICHFDVEQYCKEYKVSTEMACRELRYAKFKELKRELKADRVAVAHNADDNAETLLLNLMRGAGIKGLRGMIEDTGEIIRPLLGATRRQIIDYLDSITQDYVVDSTNYDSDYRRNFIRNRVIPLLEEEWPGAKASILESIKHLRQEEMILDSVENKLLKDNPTFLGYNDLKALPDPQWAIYRFIKSFGGNKTQANEIAKVVSNSDFQSGKIWQMNDGVVSAERNGLEFVGNQEHSFEVKCYKYKNSAELRKQILSSDNSELWTTLAPSQLSFRHVVKGDRISPKGMKGSVLVSKILKDNKLSYSEKKRTIVAEHTESARVIWVCSLKRSSHFLINDDSDEIFRYVTRETQ